jgi:hypothetical protein
MQREQVLQQAQAFINPIIIIIILAMVAILWAVYWEFRKKQLQYEERRLMIEKGMIPPPVLSGNTFTAERELRYAERLLLIEKGLAPPPDEPRPKERRPLTPADFFRWGTIMVFLGMGCAIGYVVVRNTPGIADRSDWLLGLGVVGAIVGMAGVGSLVCYFFSGARDTPGRG